MNSNDVDTIAKSLGCRVRRTCKYNAFYYLEDNSGNKIRNKNGESLIISIGFCEQSDKKHSLPVSWHKNGYTKELMTSWWSVRCYVTDKDGRCYENYNPTVKRKSNGDIGYEKNFDWHLLPTTENFEKLLREVLTRFMLANRN